MRRLASALATATLLAVVTACGADHSAASREVTVGKYGGFGPETITAQAGAANAGTCRRDAASFATGAHTFVMRFGSTAASSTDVYYVLLREQLGDLDAHGCSAATLGAALRERLTAKQRRLLVSELTRSMASRVRAALGAS